MIRRRSGRSGFTLIELMLAVLIFGFIVLTVYGVLSSAINARRVGEGRAELYAQGREVVMRIASDIEGALLPMSGDRIFFSGEAGKVGFIAMNRGGFGLNRVRPGQVLVEYSLDVPDQNGYSALIRIEQDFKYMLNQADGIGDQQDDSRFDLNDDNDVQAPTEQVQVFLECPPGAELSDLPGVCSRVVGLRFRFYDDAFGDWRETWDSFGAGGGTEDRIPAAVEIMLVMLDEQGSEHEFYTVVDLPLAVANPTPGAEDEDDLDDDEEQ